MAFVETSFYDLDAISTQMGSEWLLLDVSLNLFCLSLLQCTAGPSETMTLWMCLNSSVESLYCTLMCLLRTYQLTGSESQAL